jgi:hypothetical protein
MNRTATCSSTRRQTIRRTVDGRLSTILRKTDSTGRRLFRRPSCAPSRRARSSSPAHLSPPTADYPRTAAFEHLLSRYR